MEIAIARQGDRDCADVYSVSMEASLLDENRALKGALVERDEAIIERDARIVALERDVARVSELERAIAALEEQLQGAAKDRALLEARLMALLAQRRATAEADAIGQKLLDFAEEQQPGATPPCATEAPDGESASDVIRPRHQRKNAPRKVDFAALPRERVKHELPLEARRCAVTGAELVVVGEKITEELEYRPGMLVVIEHHRAVYGASAEVAAERKVHEIVAPLPPRALEDTRAGAGLLAWTLVQKYVHHLPLYRQQAIFEREGLFLPRQTLCDWTLAAAEQLAPIRLALKEQILTSGVFQLDDTPVRLQGRKGESLTRARLWTYASPLVSGAVFDFGTDWGHEHAKDFIGPDASGYLVGDGYAGYQTICTANPKLVECGCWAHVLRKLKDALKEAPVEVLRLMRPVARLFDVEREADEAQVDFDERTRRREERSQPALGELEKELEVQRGKGSMSSKWWDARGYIERQWPRLVRFIEDGRVPIHNNTCERAIRPVAIGRRNWLFAGSVRGGEAAAIVYTAVESCKSVGVDPFEYLKDVLVRVATHPASRVVELVPARWKESFGAAARG
jgi:transposase